VRFKFFSEYNDWFSSRIASFWSGFACAASVIVKKDITGTLDNFYVKTYIYLFLFRPILSNLERQDVAASQTLRAAFSKVYLNTCTF
jgi:Protein of unknown function (DUF1241)